jgi:hypothetical protein
MKCSEHRVLDSGTRVANQEHEALLVALVHPDAKLDDEIAYISGCSTLVVLRRNLKSEGSVYMVITTTNWWDISA